jgi:hypothetical protein
LFRIYKLDGTKYAIFLILFFLQLFHFSYYWVWKTRGPAKWTGEILPGMTL